MIRRPLSLLDRYTRTAESARALAGCALVAAGTLSLLGIATGEALFPGEYSTHANAISELGGRSEDGVLPMPSWWIFNVAMVLSGVLLGIAAYGLHRGLGIARMTRAVALLAVGTLGVGLFPEYVPTLHRVFAGMTFISGGVGAVLAAQVTPRPFGYPSAALGVIALVALDVVVFGKSTFIYQGIGPGGIERWVAYPVILWQVAFGAFVLGWRDGPPRHPPVTPGRAAP